MNTIIPIGCIAWNSDIRTGDRGSGCMIASEPAALQHQTEADVASGCGFGLSLGALPECFRLVPRSLLLKSRLNTAMRHRT